MPTPAAFKAPFYYNDFYHLIFKSIDDVLLFRSPGNKQFFLERFSFFLHPFLTCWAWTLLDNHAHFIIRVCAAENIYQHLEAIPEEIRTVSMKKLLSVTDKTTSPDELVERQINRLMVSYVNAYNNLYKRRGSLFISPFRRSVISGETHLQQAIIYIHANAQKHGLVDDYRQYSHSSYHEIIGGDSLFTDRQAVLEFFGGKEQFIEQHKTQADYYYAPDE